MAKNMKKFRKKGSTFDIEYKVKQSKLKKPKKKLAPKPKEKNMRIIDFLEEE